MPFMLGQGHLPKLDLEVDKRSDFIAWTEQWDAYLTLSGLEKEEPTTQAKVLRLCFSRDTLSTVNNLGLSDSQKNNPVAIIKALRTHVEGQINVTRRAQKLSEAQATARRNIRRFPL